MNIHCRKPEHTLKVLENRVQRRIMRMRLARHVTRMILNNIQSGNLNRTYTWKNKKQIGG